MRESKQRNYDEEFKKQAVSLYIEQGKSCRQLGKELGIPDRTLSGWVNSGKYHHGQSGQAINTQGLFELKRLRGELIEVREERDILKKALAIFSQKKNSECLL